MLAAVVHHRFWLHWLSHLLGLDNLSGPFYGWWSGAGSDLTEVAVVGAIWRVLNCHEQGCWRLGLKTTMEDNGHHYRRCAKHHSARHEPGR